jgi:A/G-specific adenine glycosylase
MAKERVFRIISEKKYFLTERLLAWYSNNKRNFPWRKTTNPYNILIAEILLQKTNAEKVAPIYLEFISRHPNFNSLTKATQSELSELLRPLGLYRVKAKNLLRIAKIMSEGGTSLKSKLTSLPGVGDYILNSVLVFGYGERRILLDTNIRRVVNRFFGLKIKKDPRRDKRAKELAEKILPHKNIKNFYWAIIDFASSVCRFKAPQCTSCSLRSKCDYFTRHGAFQK